MQHSGSTDVALRRHPGGNVSKFTFEGSSIIQLHLSLVIHSISLKMMTCILIPHLSIILLCNALHLVKGLIWSQESGHIGI